MKVFQKDLNKYEDKGNKKKKNVKNKNVIGIHDESKKTMVHDVKEIGELVKLRVL